MHPTLRFLPALLLLLAATPLHADFLDHPRTPQLLDTLAKEHGFDDAALDVVRAALDDAKLMPQLVRQEQTAPEHTRTWTDYRPIHVNETNVRNGVAFLNEHRATLERAEAEYGVPPALITAILGVETKYGSFTGPTRVLDALATQGFEHPRRSDFFFSELVHFFVLAREHGFVPTQPRGSYAGAMGWAQFMPSNYRRLAVDFDGDGVIDLWNPVDAIGSIARYLVEFDPRSAWQPGQPMVLSPRRFQVHAEAIEFNTGRPNSTLAELAKLGAEPTRSLNGDTPAGLLRLDLNQGREFLIALPNFYAVMRYNPRVFYALSVGQLAEAIARADGQPAGRFTP